MRRLTRRKEKMVEKGANQSKITSGFWKERRDINANVTMKSVSERFSDRFEALKCIKKERILKASRTKVPQLKIFVVLLYQNQENNYGNKEFIHIISKRQSTRTNSLLQDAGSRSPR